MTESTQISRVSVSALDEILGVKFPVLDKGFIRVVDYMGDDTSICQAARISYGAGTKTVNEDRGLIRYLMRHRHTTPFEMCELKLHIKMPMDAWRQQIRHRMASVNEYSTRYSEAIDERQETLPGEWRLQSGTNKQGSGGFLDADPMGDQLSKEESEFQQLAQHHYERRLAAGIAREQARKDLPLSTYTEAYWKIDLHNLLHYLSLRMDSHAQKEIRDYATIIGETIVAKWVPLVWEAFTDYRLKGASLSRMELDFIRSLTGDVLKSVGDESFKTVVGSLGIKGRELDEFMKKVGA
jgi:thymidylate synthase (FAD)